MRQRKYLLSGLLLITVFVASPPAPAGIGLAARVRFQSSAISSAECPSSPALPEYLTVQATDDERDHRAALLARAANDPDRAITLWNAVATNNGPLAPLARFRVAETLRTTGRADAAVPLLQQAAGDALLPAKMRVEASVVGAEVLQQQQRTVEALSLLDGIASVSGASGSDIASARASTFRIRRALGQPGWVSDARTLAIQYPSSSSAVTALNALEEIGSGLPALSAGLVRYRAQDNNAATAHFSAVVNSGASSAADQATAWFYLGALAERFDNPEDALGAYANALAASPRGPFADDALWWRGRIYEDIGRPLDAASEYETLADGFADSSYTREAAFQAAFLRARAGDRAGAVARLRNIATRYGPEDAALAARWLAVLGGGENLSPVTIAPGSFAAVLERAGTTAISALPEAARSEWSFASPDWSRADDWMRAQFGEPPAQADGGALSAAVHMDAAGERALADSLLGAQLAARRGSPYALLDLARVASKLEFHDLALSATRSLLTAVTGEERVNAPPAILQLAYPAPFCEETLEAARAEGVPPLLLLALVRQESAFDPFAGSPAGAQGLTQVIQPTGRDIAGALGIVWDPADLMQPRTSLRFGANYLGSQIRQFDGNIFAALAAYNAGPGSARRWLRDQVYPGADGFFESVDYSETRLYLERVIENYGWYRYLYGGAAQPSIS